MIFGHMGKKNVVQRDLKKSGFPQICIFSKIWARNDFFKVISKKLSFPRNVDIYVDMGNSELGGLVYQVDRCEVSVNIQMSR